MRAPILFIFHGGCFDGFTAAWLFNKFKKKKESIIDRPVEYFAAKYGEDPPDCRGKEVWLVDFSYPREVMIEKIIKPSMRTVILDHHKTAEADLDGILDEVRRSGLQRQNDLLIFDMTRSGCGILYDELVREAGQRAGVHTPSPHGRGVWLVDYVEDRDLWRWKLPNSKEVSAYYSTLPMTFDAWDQLEKDGLKVAVEAGQHISKYIDNYGDKAIENMKVEKISDYFVPTVTLQYMNVSDHVGKLAEKFPEYPFAAGYFRRSDGLWQFSLRARKGNFDVSKVAQQFGGGGHKEAAGFQVAKLPWDECPEIVHFGEDSE